MWALDLALGWQQGAVSPCGAKKSRFSQEFLFPSGKPPWFSQLPAWPVWGREVLGELEDFIKRAVVKHVWRKTKQLPVCGWKILLGTWRDGHHHPPDECV